MVYIILIVLCIILLIQSKMKYRYSLDNKRVKCKERSYIIISSCSVFLNYFDTRSKNITIILIILMMFLLIINIIKYKRTEN